MRICKIKNCNTKHLALGYCSKHYTRFKKYNNPLKAKFTWGGSNINKYCKYCNKKFTSYISFKRKFCSRECTDKFKIGKFFSKKTCKKMSIAFLGHPSWNKGKSYNCGSKHPLWKNGRIKDGQGYIRIRKPKHPFHSKTGYVPEHRLIIEKQIGRYLHKWEICHHINKIRDDNRPENLILFKNKSAHRILHNNEYFKYKEINPKDIIFDGSKAKRIIKE